MALQRLIVGYHADEEDEWVAELDCGHGQHLRHQPPFLERPWVQSEAGREHRLGDALDCKRCDRLEIPDGFAAYQRTATFRNDTIPRGLRSQHSTKAGVWARICVLRGKLRYRLHSPLGGEQILDARQPGIAPPGVEHEVEALGDVEFYVEFYRASS